jgi:hypothetical protein
VGGGGPTARIAETRFLGILTPDNDALYLPLRKGSNELVLALSELCGGWGFVTRLAPAR